MRANISKSQRCLASNLVLLRKKRRECSGSEEEESQGEQSRGREEYTEPPVKKMRLAKKIETKIVKREDLLSFTFVTSQLTLGTSR